MISSLCQQICLLIWTSTCFTSEKTGNNCRPSWTGPGCQYSDIANKDRGVGLVTKHLDHLEHQRQPPKLAIDNNNETCSMTAESNSSTALNRKFNPFWKVWFPANESVGGVIIETRNKTIGNFQRGFHLYVEIVEESEKKKGKRFKAKKSHLCHNSTHDAQLQSTIDIFCDKPLFGNQIRVELLDRKAQLVICDIRVYKACTEGKYGPNCSDECSGHCEGAKPDLCNIINGSCPEGCQAGWNGSQCGQECTDGYYGGNCSHECSGHCGGDEPNKCNRIIGSCPEGCQVGWNGTECNKECRDGYYGRNCSLECSGHCGGDIPNKCNHINGSCPEGCQAGWNGSECSIECTKGYYGEECSHLCSGHCEEDEPSNCNHINGSCPGGCQVGWNGSDCNKECTDGYYGGNCSLECSGHCRGDKPNKCNHINGSCPKGCQAGWNGSECSTECLDGYYGEECLYVCSGHCGGDKPSNCNHTNGSCPEGCQVGWNGSDCNKECTNGYYGGNCSHHCSGHCGGDKPKKCNHINGTCPEGCQVGWNGSECNIGVLKRSEEEIVSPVLKFATGGTATFIVVFVVIVAVLVVSRRRHLKRHKKLAEVPDQDAEMCLNSSYNNETFKFTIRKDQRGPDTTGSSGSKRDSDESTENLEAANNTYANTTPAPKDKLSIKLSDLRKFIINKSLSDFETEFQFLPSGALYPTEEALKPENKGKNRYKEIYPYDKCRVVLTKVGGELGSDYINASYINGYSKQSAYIAAQGPTDANVNDFWRMIYENKVKKIVMLTKCIEAGKMKCIKYWPDFESEKFGTIEVIQSAEEVFADFTVRSLTIRNIKKSNYHDVTQYHYTTWPDQNTPDNTSSLLHFWQKVRKGDAVRKQTWLVHCSAGVGRTGTFIGLDYLYDEGKANGTISVYKCVNSLREQRINMVQKKEQYKFLHEVAYEALCSTSDPIEIEFFPAEYSHLREKCERENKTNLKVEYEQMSLHVKLDSQVKDSTRTAKIDCNISKNRFQHIFPADRHMPYLTTEVPGCTSYINAVYIPMYRNTRGFIVTQNPMSLTVVDFYRLLYEKDVSVIVSFDDEKPSEAIVPNRGSVTNYGPFSVELQKETKMTAYTIRTIKYSYTKEQADKVIEQFVFKKWSRSRCIPKETDAFMALITEIGKIHAKEIHRPVVVKCLNGADKSGLFCVVWNILERLIIDGEVAIPQTIRSLRHRRPQFIPNIEQYSFCHDVVLRRTDGTNIYANI